MAYLAQDDKSAVRMNQRTAPGGQDDDVSLAVEETWCPPVLSRGLLSVIRKPDATLTNEN